jgi:hypothetical protein
MGLADLMLLLDREDRLHRLAASKFEEMMRHPMRHLPLFAGQRVHAASVIVELEERRPRRVIRSTFEILTFDAAGHLDSEQFERHQAGRIDVLAAKVLPHLYRETDHGRNVIDADYRFLDRGGR